MMQGSNAAGHPSPCRRLLSLRLLFVAAVLVLANLAAPTLSQETSKPDRERLDRLQRQLEIYRHERTRHQNDDFFRISREHATQLEEEGLKQLPNKNEIIDAAKGTLDAVLGVVAGKLASHEPTASERTEQTAILSRVLQTPGNVLKSTYDALRIAQEDEKSGGSPKSALDREIQSWERARVAIKAATSLDFVGLTSPYDKVGDTVISGPLIRAYLERAKLATTDTERRLYRDKALKEGAKALTNVVGLGKDAFRSGFATELRLAQLNAEIWSKNFYWLGTALAARSERALASRVQTESIADLNYRILVTQYQIDQEEKRVRRAAKPQREPGGIKMSGIAADAIAARIDVSAVSYDPLHGRLILSGKRSEHAIDLGIFRDVLRLAVEEHEPFFSLNPVNAGDWDSSGRPAQDALYQKYLRSEGGRQIFADRMRQLGTRLPVDDGRACYHAQLRDIDPDISSQIESRLDTREERVYSPEWLAHSPVGRILYEADLAIKAVAEGLVETDSGVSIASVWKISGFKPRWQFEKSNDKAGRANFELDESRVPTDGTTMDLSQVKPKLKMVRREPGTSRDLPPSDNDQLVSSHFDEHWREYVDRVPVLGELMAVFRAYVAARYIVQHHPGLTQRILAMGDPFPASGTPFYAARSQNLITCLSGNRLVPLRPGRAQLLYVGRGFGGGITFKYAQNVSYSAMPSGVLSAAAVHLGSAEGFRIDGDSVAMALDLETIVPYGREEQLALWTLCLGVAGAAGGAIVIMGALLRRRKGAGVLACPHCRRLHRWTEAVAGVADVCALGTLAFVVALPFAAALFEIDGSLGLAALIALAVFAALTLAAGVAALAQQELARLLGWRGSWNGTLRRIGAGARWTGLGLAAVLLSAGLSAEAVDIRLVALLGPEMGERLLALLGAGSLLQIALFTLVASALSAAAARWLAPFVLGSRPLPIGIHSHNSKATP